MKNRLQHFDVIKFIAIMWIFFVHFIASFRPSLFRFWSTIPTSIILNGVTGKFATTILAVILGYFAYYKGTQKQMLFTLVLKRYISFFVMGLFANIIYSLQGGHALLVLSTLKDIFITSAKIDSRIFPTFWCMQAFFWGSIMSYINGRYSISWLPIMMQIIMFMLTHNTWIAICLMGNILYRIIDTDILNPNFHKIIVNPKIQILIFLIIFVVIKRPESELTYFVDGICSVLILMVISCNEELCNMFSNQTLANLGKYSMGIFILHPVIYNKIGGYIYSISSDSMSTFFIAFSFSILAVIPLAIILVSLINSFVNLIMNILAYVEEKLLIIFYRLGKIL